MTQLQSYIDGHIIEQSWPKHFAFYPGRDEVFVVTGFGDLTDITFVCKVFSSPTAEGALFEATVTVDTPATGSITISPTKEQTELLGANGKAYMVLDAVNATFGTRVSYAGSIDVKHQGTNAELLPPPVIVEAAIDQLNDLIAQSTQIVAEVESIRDETAALLSGVVNNEAQVLNLPSEFNWFAGKIWIDLKGQANTDLTFDSFKFTPTSTMFWDYKDGDNAADGLTISTAKRGLSGIIAAGADEIICVTKFVDRRYLSGFTITKDTIVKSLHDETIFTAADLDVAYTQLGAQPIWQRAESNVVSVYDKQTGRFLKKVANTTAVIAEAGTWATNGTETQVYVRTEDSREADDSVWVILNVASNIASTGNNTLLLDGISFFGFREVTATSETNNVLTYVAQNNSYQEMADNNGFSLRGGNSYHFNSFSDSNSRDGFNYHWSPVDNLLPNAFEYGCSGKNNGIGRGSFTDNGSTMHDGGSIIQIDCNYMDNEGPNIAHVNDSSSLIINCSARAQSFDYVGQSNIFIGGGNSWIIGGDSLVGAETSLSLQFTPIVRQHGHIFDVVVNPADLASVTLNDIFI